MNNLYIDKLVKEPQVPPLVTVIYSKAFQLLATMCCSTWPSYTSLVSVVAHLIKPILPLQVGALVAP